MKRYIVYFSLFAIFGALFGWGVFRAYRAFKISMEPIKCVCIVSPESSDQAGQALIKLLEQSILEKKESLASAVQGLQKEFPHCTSITCRQQPSGLVQARIELDEPLCTVNDDALLTAHGMLVSKSVYVDEALTGLPHLCMESAHSGDTLSPYMLSFLRHIPEDVLVSHEVLYRSDDDISLIRRLALQSDGTQSNKLSGAESEGAQKDISSGSQGDLSQKNRVAKNQRDILQPIYLCAVDTVLDRDLLTRCDKVMADLEQQKTMSKKKMKTAWVLDLRFDKQIILYPHMGGQVHG